MRDDLFALGREAEIILLDYQCTLCLNGTGRQAWLRNPDNRNRNYDEWYFNPDGDYLPPPQHKERVIHSAVFPRFGTSEQTAYLALESNRLTRAMYQRNGVTAIRIDMPLEELPLV